MRLRDALCGPLNNPFVEERCFRFTEASTGLISWGTVLSNLELSSYRRGEANLYSHLLSSRKAGHGMPRPRPCLGARNRPVSNLYGLRCRHIRGTRTSSDTLGQRKTHENLDFDRSSGRRYTEVSNAIRTASPASSPRPSQVCRPVSARKTINKHTFPKPKTRRPRAERVFPFLD